MPSQAIHGRQALLYVGATPTKIGELREVTLTIERSTVDVTSHDTSGWMEFLPSLASWSVSAEALYIEDDAGQLELYNALALEPPVPVDISFRPEGTGTGLPEFTGSGIIVSWDETGPNDDAAALSLEITGSGALVKGTQT